MTSRTKRSELLLAATSEDYVKQYDNFGEFETEMPSILYDICSIPIAPIDTGTHDIFDIKNILLGEPRIVQLKYPRTNIVLLLDFTPATGQEDAFMIIYVKCDGSVPSSVFYDDVKIMNFEANKATPKQLAIDSCKPS